MSCRTHDVLTNRSVTIRSTAYDTSKIGKVVYCRLQWALCFPGTLLQVHAEYIGPPGSTCKNINDQDIYKLYIQPLAADLFFCVIAVAYLPTLQFYK